MKADTENCQGCRFFFSTEAPEQGFCRRYPPAVSVTEANEEGVQTTYTAFPSMHPVFGWCGEFKSKKYPAGYN